MTALVTIDHRPTIAQQPGNVEALKSALQEEISGKVRFDAQARALYTPLSFPELLARTL